VFATQNVLGNSLSWILLGDIGTSVELGFVIDEIF
jgi:hypothetical protein